MSALITQGMPLYNAEAFLPAALDALLGQSYETFELVISDNGSTDGTEAICRDYAARDERIVYLRSDENRGLAWNWNRLVEVARGPYFRWAAHDDLVAPTLLQETAGCLDELGDEYVLAYPRTIEIAFDGEVVGRYDDGVDLREETPHERLAHLLRRLRMCNVLFGLVRTDVLRSTGLMRPYGHADRVLLAELALRGRFAEVPEHLFFRRMEGRSLERVADAAELDRLYDPKARAVGMTWTRVYAAHHAAIWRAPIGATERVRCSGVLTRDWSRYRAMAREARALGRRALPRRSPAS